MISYTSRPIRKGEINKVDYYFVTKEEFKKEIEKDSFLEHCEVHGKFYGTNKKIL